MKNFWLTVFQFGACAGWSCTSLWHWSEHSCSAPAAVPWLHTAVSCCDRNWGTQNNETRTMPKNTQCTRGFQCLCPKLAKITLLEAVSPKPSGCSWYLPERNNWGILIFNCEFQFPCSAWLALLGKKNLVFVFQHVSCLLSMQMCCKSGFVAFDNWIEPGKFLRIKSSHVLRFKSSNVQFGFVK